MCYSNTTKGKKASKHVMVLVSILGAVFAGCSADVKPADDSSSGTEATATPTAESGHEFIGSWQMPNVAMTITREGDLFVIDCTNPTGVLNGKFVGTLTPVGLKVDAGFVGEQLITYSKDDDTISFIGETFSRTQ